ncbi:MAG: cell division/cell wall cluster transcriptional repressor MraZ [Chloroflexi bacterium]|nr:cell division/cell wall cluster transcriptional repressor MraZ [Chloroflexota bacterium]
MDERGRVPLPPIYRDAFREGVVLSQGHPDPCLRVFTRGAFEAQASEFTADSAMLQRGRDLRRAFFATARHVELDKQNRILIPGPLRQSAGLDREVLVIGTGECLEIWDPKRWEAESDRLMSTLGATMESAVERRNV